MVNEGAELMQKKGMVCMYYNGPSKLSTGDTSAARAVLYGKVSIV